MRAAVVKIGLEHAKDRVTRLTWPRIDALEASPPSCYQFEMSKFIGLEFTPLSKPFKTREQAEKAHERYPERLRKKVGLGVIRRNKKPGLVACRERHQYPRYGRSGRGSRTIYCCRVLDLRPAESPGCSGWFGNARTRSAFSLCVRLRM
jgi:hypothetical protein